MAREDIKDGTYILIQSFMIKELNLSGNELLLYAIIYGFSQDGTSAFTGTQQYLADMLGVSTNTVGRLLLAMCESGLIEKKESKTRSPAYQTKYVVYPTKCGSEPHKMLGNNNIYNNIKNNKKEKEKKKKGSPLYEKCSAIVYEKFTDPDIIDNMLKYLSIRIRVGLTEEQWRSIAEDLFNLADTKEDALEIIDEAYKGGYRKLYARKASKKSGYKDNIIKTEKTDAGKLRDEYREEFSMVLPKDRPDFDEWLKQRGENKDA